MGNWETSRQSAVRPNCPNQLGAPNNVVRPESSQQVPVNRRQGLLLKPVDLDLRTPLNRPPLHPRYRRRRRWEQRKICPYCLADLTDYDREEFKELGYVCPLCRHTILDHLLTTPVYQFTSSQQWDLLANEMEFVWNAEYRDVDSYLFGMGSYYNPDYSEAKERLYGDAGRKRRAP